MFCPSADLGNAADWVSGVSTAIAVIVALVVAIREGFERKQERRAALVEDAQIENAFRVEALALYRVMQRVCQQVVDYFESGTPASLDSWKLEFRRCREAALRFQQMPKINLAAYQTLNDVIFLTQYADEIDDFPDEEIETLFASIICRCEESSIIIETMANPKAPLLWDD